MHTYQISANITGPAGTLIPDELPDAGLLYLVQILNHAHSIFLAVSLIQVLQALTWKGWTGMITVFTVSFLTETQCTRPAAPGVWRQTAITFIPGPYIANAKPAVHTTWGNL